MSRMAIITLGLNHNTAPISIRERLAFPSEQMVNALRKLRGQPGVDEAAILSTCNRTEVYCGTQDWNPKAVIAWIANEQNICPEELQAYLYQHQDHSTVRHMFRVASGLDSMVLGEPQILGQMKSAYQAAYEAGTLGKTLSKLFQHTFAAAKKVRTDTAIGNSPVSVAFAAVRLAQRIFEDLRQQTAILVGAGETIELTARHLAENQIGELIIANRTYDRAHSLAQQFNGFAISLAELPQHLARADILVSSTASPLPILGKGSVESAIKSRRHKPIFMVDLAVPRDIEPEVEHLRDVYLYTVDDLRNTIEENIKSRQEAAKQAEEIIDSEVIHFLDWMKAQDANDTIKELRQIADTLRAEALMKAERQLRSGQDPEAVVRYLADLLTKKLTHIPSAQLRQASMHERADLIQAARELFKLKDSH